MSFLEDIIRRHPQWATWLPDHETGPDGMATFGTQTVRGPIVRVASTALERAEVAWGCKPRLVQGGKA